MLTLDCKYNQIKIFTDELESSAESQLRAMCEQPFMQDSKIRIMPDVHAGKGCTIGTTMTIGEYVVPNMVGVDIGCGMLTVRLKEKRLNLPELDSFIRNNIPHGRDVRDKPHRSHGRIQLDELRCYNKLDTLVPLGGLQKLNNVYMDYNKGITLVKALADCPMLIQVNVYGTGVRNVSVLTAMNVIVNYDPT